METVVKWAHSLWNGSRITLQAKPPKDPEPVNATPRSVTGFFSSLSADQKRAALDYKGAENHGDPELLTAR